MSTETSLAIIAICQLLATIAVVGLVVATILFVRNAKISLEAKGKEIMDKVDPIVQDAKSISSQTKNTVDILAARVDNISGRVEETATKLTDHVDSVAERVDSAVTPQMATAVGTAATVAKVMEVLIRTSSVAKSAKKAAGDQDDKKK